MGARPELGLFLVRQVGVGQGESSLHGSSSGTGSLADAELVSPNAHPEAQADAFISDQFPAHTDRAEKMAVPRKSRSVPQAGHRRRVRPVSKYTLKPTSARSSSRPPSPVSRPKTAPCGTGQLSLRQRTNLRLIRGELVRHADGRWSPIRDYCRPGRDSGDREPTWRRRCNRSRAPSRGDRQLGGRRHSS